MIIEKKVKYKVDAGVSINGSCGRYININIGDSSIDIADILNDISVFLECDYLWRDLENIIASDKGLYIHISASEVADDGISYSEYMKGLGVER